LKHTFTADVNNITIYIFCGSPISLSYSNKGQDVQDKDVRCVICIQITQWKFTFSVRKYLCILAS